MARRRPRKSNIQAGFSYGEAEFHEQLARSTLEVRGVAPEGPPSLAKSIINELNGQGEVHRLAFEVDPAQINTIGGTYHPKYRLCPDTILKRIAIQDSLVSTIVRGRQEQMSPFGRPRPTRHDNGFVFEPLPGVTDGMQKEQKAALDDMIERGVKLLSTCGHTEGLPDIHQRTLSEWLAISVRSAIVVGRIATEVVYTEDGGDKKFHHFVAADAGTIYRATHDQTALEAIRQEAYHLLSGLAGKKLRREPAAAQEKRDYAWVQVLDGKAVEVFTNDELKCFNFYPVPDVELNGYPVTPIDTVISAITTHINIVTHNKLYFQSGRATRGMLVLKSDDATLQTVNNIKQHFNASINNVNNSWRMPVFSCGADENIEWTPIEAGSSRDMEFQYLTDMNAREIMSAFMMSPDELPGWAYLSRGTNNQALSESNNEYKLEAARDLGIRPILAKFEDFLNLHLLPLIDPKLARLARVRLAGLDADNAEKEAVRTQQDMGIWMTYDDVMERVEKKPLGAFLCGTMPLNPVIKAYIDQCLTVGEIDEHFRGLKGAAQDPQKAYKRDPYFFQWLQFQQSQQQMAQQAQAAQQQAQPGAAPGTAGVVPPPDGAPQQGGQDEKVPTEHQKTAGAEQASASPDQELGKALDQAQHLMTKAEADWPADKRRLLARQKATIAHWAAGWAEDLQAATADIVAVATKHAPKKE